jgi:Phosphotransferase enzyme family
MKRPTRKIVQRLERRLHKRIVGFSCIQQGYSAAERWIIRCADDTSVFVKTGFTEDAKRWLRQEYQVYSSVKGTFIPQLLGWDDDSDPPLLILEDLSQDFWPPPWNDARVEAVLASLENMHATTVSSPPFEAGHSHMLRGWHQVEMDPKPFLSLALASASWLEKALPVLVDCEIHVDLTGSCLTHFDIRSDNICLVHDRAVLIDWNFARIGNPRLDLGFWLPSLYAEGGPQPEVILPDAGNIAALVSGFFACRAGLPLIPHAPRIRDVQRTQLKTALCWVARSLALPPLDGKAYS